MSLEQAIQSWRFHLDLGSKWTVKILGSEYIGQIADVYYNSKVGSIMVEFDVLNHFWELTYRCLLYTSPSPRDGCEYLV